MYLLYVLKQLEKQLILFNPYSILTPPRGVLGFLKIAPFIDIFIQQIRNMYDAVRLKVKYNYKFYL
jgi:hypothetical protein